VYTLVDGRTNRRKEKGKWVIECPRANKRKRVRVWKRVRKRVRAARKRELECEREREREKESDWTWCEIPLGNLISFGKFGPFVDNSPIRARCRYYCSYHHHTPPPSSTQRPSPFTKHYQNAATVQLYPTTAIGFMWLHI